MKIRQVLTVCALVLMASSAAAQDQAEEAAPDDEKKICKLETATGSRLRKKRTCLTKAQWEQVAQQTQENMRRVGSRQGHQTPANPSAAPNF